MTARRLFLLTVVSVWWQAGCAPGCTGPGGTPDAGTGDAGVLFDSGVPDAGGPDAGPGDAGAVARLPLDFLLYSGASAPVADPCGGVGPDFNIGVMRHDGKVHGLFDAGVNGPGDELWPRLSPDRRRFVFYRSPIGKSSELCRYDVQELWLANVDGTGVRRIFSNDDKKAVAMAHGWPTTSAYQGHADWSPDNRHVVMFMGYNPLLQAIGEGELFVLDVDTLELRQLTLRVNDAGFGQTGDCSFTADGGHVVFFGCPDEVPAGCAQPQLRSVPADSVKATHTSLVYDGGGNDAYVSPDGTQVMWMEPALFVFWQIHVAPFSPGTVIQPGQRRTVEPLGGGYGNWLPDGGGIIFNNQHSLYLNRLDGSASVKISPEGTTETFRDPSP